MSGADDRDGKPEDTTKLLDESNTTETKKYTTSSSEPTASHGEAQQKQKQKPNSNKSGAADAGNEDATQPPSGGLRRIFSILHLQEFWKGVRESWLNLPHATRLFINALIIFSILVILFVAQLALTGGAKQESAALRHHPEWITLMSSVVGDYILEEQLSTAFVHKRTDYNFENAMAARNKTDASVSSIRQFSKEHHLLFETCSSLDVSITAQLASDTDAISISTINPCLDKPTYESEIGLPALLDLRRGIRRDVVLFKEVDVVTRYQQMVIRVSQHILRAASTLSGQKDSIIQLQHLLLSRVALYYQKSRTAAAMIVSPTFVTTNSSTEQTAVFMDFIVNIRKAKFFLNEVLKPSLPEEILSGMDLLLLSSKSFHLIDALQFDVEHHVQLKSTFVMPQSGAPNNTAAVTELHQLVLVYIDTLNTNAIENKTALFIEIRSALMLAICGLFILFYCARHAYNHIAYAERNRIILRNAHVMHDVLVRVGEYSESFSRVTLAPGLAPRMMMGTHSGVLETKLHMCLASLRAIVPAMAPLLFPQLMRVRAKHQTETKGATRDTAKLIAANDELRKRKRLDLLSQEASHEKLSAEYIEMQELTSNSIHSMHAAFVTVDLGPLHQINTAEKLNLAEEAYAKVVTLIEACVYQFEGILYSVYGDRAVGCWGIDSNTSSCEEQAATCALALASRINGVRKLNKTLRDNFPTHVGVTAGTIKKCIFGNEETKMLQIHGPAVMRGILVARTNQHHLTTVACDDNIQKRISYQCKPIELIEDNERVHEIIHDASARKEIDLDTRLSLYKKAFELYERNYYREALRVFRSYTKQYGYDCSVERIQSIITGV